MIEIIKFLYNRLKQIFLIFPFFTIIPNIKRAPVLNWWKKNTGILYNLSTFFMPKVGESYYIQPCIIFRQIAVIKIVKSPPPPTPKKKYLPTYLPYLELIIQYLEKNPHTFSFSIYFWYYSVFTILQTLFVL